MKGEGLEPDSPIKFGNEDGLDEKKKVKKKKARHKNTQKINYHLNLLPSVS